MKAGVDFHVKDDKTLEKLEPSLLYLVSIPLINLVVLYLNKSKSTTKSLGCFEQAFKHVYLLFHLSENVYEKSILTDSLLFDDGNRKEGIVLLMDVPKKLDKPYKIYNVAKPLVSSALNKHYSLICITDTNCIFVVDEEFDKFHEFETSLEHLRNDNYLVHIITNYSGKYKIIGKKETAFPYGNSSQLRSHKSILREKYEEINRPQ